MKADTKDRINRCIAIERKILDKTSSGILGASSEEEFIPSSSSSLSGDEVSKEESKEEEVPGTEIQPNNFASFLQPPALPPFTNEPTENKVANFNAPNGEANFDAFANGPVNGFNMEVATATQVERRNSASSSIARAGRQSTSGQSTTPIPATAGMTPVQLIATKKKHRKSEKTNKPRILQTTKGGQ